MHPELGLTEQEKQEGWILTCVRTPDSDIVIEAEDLGETVIPPSQTLPCRIHDLQLLAPDVMRVTLRLPPSAQLSFLPGQYIDIIGPAGMRRSYSLANAGLTDKLLELHIRAVDAGAMSHYWFNQAKVNDLLRLNGPMGTFFLRNPANTHLIFLATGTGIAPVKAILESMSSWPAQQQPASITVAWGGRTPSDLYMRIDNMAAGIRFLPVLSRAPDDWTGARSHVQDAVLALKPDLGNARVYACGSDAMIHGAKEALLAAGLAPKHFYSDAFVRSGPT